MRIELTDEDIEIYYEGEHVEDDWYIRYKISKKPNWEDTQKEAEALKKQILEDYEFSEKLQDTNQQLIKIPELLELKDKAEKWDSLSNGNNSYSKIKAKYDELESQVKELKEELKRAKDWGKDVMERQQAQVKSLQREKELYLNPDLELKCRECGCKKGWHHVKFKTPCTRHIIKHKGCYGIGCVCGEIYELGSEG